jgi:uncharacterized membrane protein
MDNQHGGAYSARDREHLSAGKITMKESAHMTLIIILTLTGIVLGSAGLGHGGWLVGGIVGYLVAQSISLGNRIKTLEQSLDKAKQYQPPSPADISKAANQEKIKPDAPKTPDTERIPLAARINAVSPESQTAAEVAVNNPSTLAGSPVAATNNASTAARVTPSSLPPAALASQPQPQPKSQPQAMPREPGSIEKLFAAIGQFFTQGNPIVRIGMVVMFFGLSFLVKFAASEGLIPLELRLAAVAAIAMALLVLGWKTRNKEGGYGLVLQGGGIAALYLTVFAALKLYSLLPPGFAFALMLVMVMLGAALAILQNAQVLALMATAGGFLAPILTSDGSGSHVALFSFYLLLNIGILTIAWFKTWRLLNWVGFVFTFVITSAWGVLEYEPEFYANTQPFLMAFFALYLVVSVLFSVKQPPKLTGLVDGSLVFGLPIVGFGLQTLLLKHTEYGLAISALVLAAIYLLLARILWTKFQTAQRVLIESFIALGVTFATLAIPLALDAEWTSASWALEATGLIWIGLRQQRLLPRLAGYLLHVGAAISLFRHGGIEAGVTPILTGAFISLFILSASAFCISYLLQRFSDRAKTSEKQMGMITLIVGWLWWLIVGINELNGHLSTAFFPAVILFFALSCTLLIGLSRKINWPLLAHTSFWLLPLTALWTGVHFAMTFDQHELHPLKGLGWLAFGVFVCAQYRILWLHRIHPQQWLVSLQHVFAAWLICCLIFWEASWWEYQKNWLGTTSLLLWFACFTLPLIVLMQCVTKLFWPFAQYQREYKNIVSAPLLFFLCLWFFVASGQPGTTAFQYIPVLNPLDLAQLAAVVLLAYAIKRNITNLQLMPLEVRYVTLGVAIFIWLNLVVLRAIHHIVLVPYTAADLWSSPVAQMALSILWALCALGAMNLSRLFKERRLWISGAGLLAVVVLKLFTEDLSGSGTLARIISFLVVGTLMLLIGYISPMPAKRDAVKLQEDAA